MALTTHINTITSAITRVALDNDGPGGMGRHVGGFGRHGFPIIGLIGCVVLLSVVVALLSRRGWFGGSERQHGLFDEWHRLAHAGPVPTGPAVMPTASVASVTSAAPVMPLVDGGEVAAPSDEQQD